MEINRLTRDGTAEEAETVSRDQILREEIIFPVQLTTSRVGKNTPLMPRVAVLIILRETKKLFVFLQYYSEYRD